MQAHPTYFWRTLLLLAILKLGLLAFVHPAYGFHRDEFLYLALGQHIDWGYWSNPPLIGWISGCLQLFFGELLWVFRLFSGLLGAGTLLLVGRVAQLSGGGHYGQFLSGFIFLLVPAFMRTFMLFMPVPVEIFLWTLMAVLLLEYIHSGQEHFLLMLGAVTGFAILNKYSTVFFLAGLLIALAISQHRTVFLKRRFYLAAAIMLVMVLPNFLWQWSYDFPVISHMEGLVENQLVNVQLSDFLMSQFWMTFTGSLLWIPGLAVLLFHKKYRSFRYIAYTYLAVLLLFILLRGKSYYTLGLYPPLLGLGAVWLEQVLKPKVFRWMVPIVAFLLSWPLFPIGLPFFMPAEQVAFHDKLRDEWGLDFGRRWEDGREYPLPQDFADMIGWRELADLTAQALEKAKAPDQCLVFGENYGQAGAVNHYGKILGLPAAVSFSDSYRLWVSPEIDFNTLIYINDELGEDVAAAFEHIEKIGSISVPYAREARTTVYLCEQPRIDVRAFWAERVNFFQSYWKDE